jgi:hypothetical protein
MSETLSVRESFVARFGEEQAAAIEVAAKEHENGVHDERGSDPFKWAILICVGYQCMEKDDFRAYHGITAPFAEIKAWAKAEGGLDTHDGDVDYLSFMAGAYQSWMPEKVADQRAQEASA